MFRTLRTWHSQNRSSFTIFTYVNSTETNCCRRLSIVLRDLRKFQRSLSLLPKRKIKRSFSIQFGFFIFVFFCFWFFSCVFFSLIFFFVQLFPFWIVLLSLHRILGIPKVRSQIKSKEKSTHKPCLLVFYASKHNVYTYSHTEHNHMSSFKYMFDTGTNMFDIGKLC